MSFIRGLATIIVDETTKEKESKERETSFLSTIPFSSTLLNALKKAKI